MWGWCRDFWILSWPNMNTQISQFIMLTHACISKSLKKNVYFTQGCSSSTSCVSCFDNEIIFRLSYCKNARLFTDLFKVLFRYSFIHLILLIRYQRRHTNINQSINIISIMWVATLCCYNCLNTSSLYVHVWWPIDLQRLSRYLLNQTWGIYGN